MHAHTLVIFGATGDLARQKLIPAVRQLWEQGTLNAEDRVLAIGRRDIDTARFIEQLGSDVGELSSILSYVNIDLTDPNQYSPLMEYATSREMVAYLAVDPSTAMQVVANLNTAGIVDRAADFRVVLEKPFGTDQMSAQALDAQLMRYLREDQIYRIDHYLAKETVQNILAFRFGNGIFESLWNREHIDHIQITVAESAGVGTRGGYYDAAGAVRDLLQNHLLQLLAILTLEEPSSYSFDALSNAVVAVIKHLRLDPEQTVYGQYDGYLDEEKVAENSTTETYVATTGYLSLPRWSGVPIYMRTGKALARRMSEISVQFVQPDPGLVCRQDISRSANVLTFRIQPDEGISLRFGVKAPGGPMEVQPVQMEFCYSQSFDQPLKEAYVRVLADVLMGDKTLTLRSDVVSESWRAIDALLAARSGEPIRYSQGSWGPSQAEGIIQGEGRQWLAHESQVCNGVTLET